MSIPAFVRNSANLIEIRLVARKISEIEAINVTVGNIERADAFRRRCIRLGFIIIFIIKVRGRAVIRRNGL